MRGIDELPADHSLSNMLSLADQVSQRFSSGDPRRSRRDTRAGDQIDPEGREFYVAEAFFE